jgi:hypothetical protein
MQFHANTNHPILVFWVMPPQAIARHTFFTMKVFARSTIHCKIDRERRRLIDRIPTSGRLDADAYFDITS